MGDNARTVRLRVGRTIRQLRRQRGWSQERLAETVGNTYKHIGQIERGEVNVTLDILSAIAAGFSVTVGDLFGAAPTDARRPRGSALTRREMATIDDALRIVRRLKAASGRR